MNGFFKVMRTVRSVPYQLLWKYIRKEFLMGQNGQEEWLEQAEPI